MADPDTAIRKSLELTDALRALARENTALKTELSLREQINTQLKNEVAAKIRRVRVLEEDAAGRALGVAAAPLSATSAALEGPETQEVWLADHLATIHSLRPGIDAADAFKRYYVSLPSTGEWPFTGLTPPSGRYTAEFNLLLSVLFEDYGSDILDLVRESAGHYFGVPKTELPAKLSAGMYPQIFNYTSGRIPNDAHAAAAGMPPMHRSIWFLVPASRRQLAAHALAFCPNTSMDELVAKIEDLARDTRDRLQPPRHTRDAVAIGRSFNSGPVSWACAWCQGGFPARACPGCYRWGVQYKTPDPCASYYAYSVVNSGFADQTPESPSRPTAWKAWTERLALFGHATPLEWFALAPEPCLRSFIANESVLRMFSPAPASALPTYSDRPGWSAQPAQRALLISTE